LHWLYIYSQSPAFSYPCGSLPSHLLQVHFHCHFSETFFDHPTKKLEVGRQGCSLIKNVLSI
jgi:hypothetical protein